ncbi:unnamed protein product [Moneuplotes crassus]|uniref:Uncharacterized protein n=1 Tax=Euplotes crassus TaxID=5936 RepID=A0AAD1XL93_EUPCR|nr:unnamed protein product [Moneuplotes crassus]
MTEKTSQQHECGVPIFCLDFCQNPVRPYLATGFSDETVKIWKLNGLETDFKKPLATIEGLSLGASCLKFNSDGTRLVITSLDSKIRVYDIHEEEGAKEVSSHDMDAISLFKFDYHPSREEILHGTLSLSCLGLDSEAPAELQEFRNDCQFINVQKYSKNGELCACGDIDGGMHFYKFTTEGASHGGSFPHHGKAIRDIAFSNDNKHMISVSDDLHINLTELESYKIILAMTGHTREVLCCDFHPDNNHFATGSCDQVIKIWSIEKQRCVTSVMLHESNVTSLRFTPDGSYLVSGDDEGNLVVYKVQI